MPHWEWTDERGFAWNLQMHGPAAIPIASIGLSLFGAINQQNQQKAANASAQDAQNRQDATLGKVTGYADELASQNYTQSILDAGKSGIETFRANAGGVPNVGALVETLFGENIGNAQKAAAGQRTANLEGAIGGLTGAGSQYGQANRDAGAAVASGSGTNPWASVFSMLPGIMGGGSKTANTGVATGVGGSGPAPIFGSGGKAGEDFSFSGFPAGDY